MAGIEILHADADLVTGRWNDLYVESVRARFSPALVKRTNVLQVKAAQRPGLARMVSMTLLHAGFSMQRAEMDVLNEETMRDVGSLTKAGVAVLLSRGFTAAVARSLYAGFSLMKPPPFPTNMVDTVDAGAAFVAPHLDGRPSLGDVVRAVEEIDRHHR